LAHCRTRVHHLLPQATARRVPPYPETVKYVRRISRSYAQFKFGAAQNNKPQTAAKAEGLPAGK
jgi:hypothetical protein